MASFSEHLKQAEHNLDFLKSISKDYSEYWDWRVTTTFYTAVHIINAHLDKSVNKHYRSHQDVSLALNPNIALSISKVPMDVYLAYEKLSNLSRRSRYLIKEDLTDKTANVFITYDKHLARALKNLDTIESWFSSEYKITFPAIELHCLELKSGLKYFSQQTTTTTI